MRYQPPLGRRAAPPGKPLWSTAELALELGFESGNQLAPLLRAAGIKALAVQSRKSYYDVAEVRKWWASR